MGEENQEQKDSTKAREEEAHRALPHRLGHLQGATWVVTGRMNGGFARMSRFGTCCSGRFEDPRHTPRGCGG